MALLALIRDPTMIITLLFNMKPSALRAQPEELRTVMTTGMSTPPIVMARVTPITPDRVVPNMAKPTLKLD